MPKSVKGAAMTREARNKPYKRRDKSRKPSRQAQAASSKKGTASKSTGTVENSNFNEITTATNVPGLLRLPRELRDMIYEYTGTLPCDENLWVRLSDIYTPRKMWTCDVCCKIGYDCYCRRPALFLVCGQIRDEALDFFFARNHFHFETSAYFSLAQLDKTSNGRHIRAAPALRSLWAECLSRLRSIGFTLNKNYTLGNRLMLSTLARRSPLLTKLTISTQTFWTKQDWVDDFFNHLEQIPTLTTVGIVNPFFRFFAQQVFKKMSCQLQIVCDYLDFRNGIRRDTPDHMYFTNVSMGVI
ncbi:uncharacterized protein CTRU02_209444 [Colletotrichum truncatum]|uniref:Uncharacterized protein n=1 Tax=Colletotrichum truncatum TaxID=5467 RepID=A0ACC3YSE0_COLTU|nr:uncharacterized protein CTRU02_08479 [Colletotrichum truncatum]KAF6789780.1 hypothetical protein CTRU02_08479 [Colletotrichum truncatum]